MNYDTLTGFVLGAIMGFLLFGFLSSAKKNWLPIVAKWLEPKLSKERESAIVADVVNRSVVQPREPDPDPEQQNPVIEGMDLSEQELKVVQKNLAERKAEIDRLQGLSPGESAGVDLQTKLDDATREYGELYYAMYHKAPPEWT